MISTDEKNPILYVVNKVTGKCAKIIGVYYRVKREVDVSILRHASDTEKSLEKRKSEKYQYKLTSLRKGLSKKFVLGKVLHIDGDRSYLNKCLELYNEVGIYAYGVMMEEEKITHNINNYIYEINPDIIVLTGHDYYNGKGLKDLENYVNSKYFANAIKEIRKIDKSVVIVAGACMSNFEALIASGADFASSPKRINIHTYDPAVIAIKVATTSFLKVVNIENVYKYIEDGEDAFNGLETLGKMRLLL